MNQDDVFIKLMFFVYVQHVCMHIYACLCASILDVWVYADMCRNTSSHVTFTHYVFYITYVAMQLDAV